MSFGQLRRMFRYKAALDGTLLIEANRWFPSSKRCSARGAVHAGLTLGDTRWTCPTCGVDHDRDANAAENLAWYGRIVIRLVRGEDALSGLPIAGTIAQVVIAKYLNHMPLHRQAAHYARLGVLLATTTLYGWVEAAARDLAPVATGCSSCCSGGPRSMPTTRR